MNTELILEQMGYTLPAPPAKGGVYTPIKLFGTNLAYASGFGPATENVTVPSGKMCIRDSVIAFPRIRPTCQFPLFYTGTAKKL